MSLVFLKYFPLIYEKLKILTNNFQTCCMILLKIVKLKHSLHPLRWDYYLYQSTFPFTVVGCGIIFHN